LGAVWRATPLGQATGVDRTEQAMGNVVRKINLVWKRKRKKVYISEDVEEEEEAEDDGMAMGEFIPFEETADRLIYTKYNIKKQLETVSQQSQQAIIDATIISTRKNKYRHHEAQLDMSPNPYILRAMTSRSSKDLHDKFVEKNQREILSQVAVLQTIQGYRTDEVVDDQAILHEHEAYFSKINYYLTSPTDS
jgi:hypothetical protein